MLHVLPATSTNFNWDFSSCLVLSVPWNKNQRERTAREKPSRVYLQLCLLHRKISSNSFFLFTVFIRSPFLQFSMLFKHVFLSQFKFFSHGRRQEQKAKEIACYCFFLNSIFWFCYWKWNFWSLVASEKSFLLIEKIWFNISIGFGEASMLIWTCTQKKGELKRAYHSFLCVFIKKQTLVLLSQKFCICLKSRDFHLSRKIYSVENAWIELVWR